LQGGCANQQRYLREKPFQFLIADDHVFYREGVRALLSHSPHSRIKSTEVMRDLDLVVSVAHAGGIDPESSTFLPFADNDPKTAEIVSKVILLARDELIKDSTILEHIL
jgi:hypothetical protein